MLLFIKQANYNLNVKADTKLYSERNSLPQASVLFNLQSLKPGAFNLDRCYHPHKYGRLSQLHRRQTKQAL